MFTAVVYNIKQTCALDVSDGYMFTNVACNIDVSIFTHDYKQHVFYNIKLDKTTYIIKLYSNKYYTRSFLLFFLIMKRFNTFHIKSFNNT